MRPRSIIIATAIILASCAATPPAKPPETEPEEAPPSASQSTNPTEASPLKVVMGDQTTTGRVMMVRGRIVNPYSEPVTGVRMQLVFVTPDGQGGAKVHDILQKELGATIPPGGSTPLHWDVESTYAGASGGFLVAAYPKRLGDKDLPPPDNWKE